MNEDLKEVRVEPWGPGRKGISGRGNSKSQRRNLLEDWESVYPGGHLRVQYTISEGPVWVLLGDLGKPPLMRQVWGMPGGGRETPVHSWLQPVLEAGLLRQEP